MTDMSLEFCIDFKNRHKHICHILDSVWVMICFPEFYLLTVKAIFIYQNQFQIRLPEYVLSVTQD